MSAVAKALVMSSNWKAGDLPKRGICAAIGWLSEKMLNNDNSDQKLQETAENQIKKTTPVYSEKVQQE